jgi:hypothetical protein
MHGFMRVPGFHDPPETPPTHKGTPSVLEGSNLGGLGGHQLGGHFLIRFCSFPFAFHFLHFESFRILFFSF